MAAYLTLTRFKALTLMPSTYVDAIETLNPGWIDAQLTVESARIDTRLAKRYSVPFAAPVPLAVENWLTKIVTWNALLKRGIESTDKQTAEYKDHADTSWQEIREAADSDTGLFDLPLRADTNLTGVSRGFPRAYSEQSPYVGLDVQAEAARLEDANHTGTETLIIKP